VRAARVQGEVAVRARAVPEAGQVWRGRGSVLGREIRITDVDEAYAWYEGVAGVRGAKGWRRIRLTSLRASYELMPPGGGHHANGVPLTEVEARAVASLRRLAGKWPSTLKLVIVNGRPAVLLANAPVQAEHVIAVMKGMRAE